MRWRVQNQAYRLLLHALGILTAGVVWGQDASDAAPTAPPWVPGYGVRYVLRVLNPEATRKTVMARIPTGGWLKPDASDLVLRTADGTDVPVMVLSHCPAGDTLVQFRRVPGSDWYWLYGHNPKAPSKDAALEQRIEQARVTAERATLSKMAALKRSADQAAALRDTSAELHREQETVRKATAELAEWDKLLPERMAAAAAAAKKVPPAKQAADQAAAAHAPLQKVADEKTARARSLKQDASTAEKAASQAAAALDTAKQDLEVAKRRVQQAQDEAQSAAQALAKADNLQKPEAQHLADAKAKAVTVAQAAVPKAEAALQKAKTALATAQQKEKQATAAADAADKDAQAARLAAAPTAAAKQKADKELANASATASRTASAVKDARTRIAAAKKLKATSEKAVAALTPKVEALKKAADAARQAADNAVTQAASSGDAYFDLAADADPRLLKEGLTVEYRQWEGDELADWPAVVDGLQRSDNIVDNAILGELQHNIKPFRRTEPRNFAASYRGFLKIDKPGIYSFCVNADDATFLFINGYRVYSRTGSNRPMRGRAPIYSIGADIQLDAGVHPFEVHNVIGNTPGATGYCKLLWIPPGAKGWSIVPREVFPPSLIAIPVTVEGPDNRQAAVFEFGRDDALTADGVTVYLERLEARGRILNPSALTWDFGDGTTMHGASVLHPFLSAGNVDVSLKSSPSLPPFHRLCYVAVPPVPTGPHSLSRTVEVFDQLPLAKLSIDQLNDTFHFLNICEQPNRWPVLEKLCRVLLTKPTLDIKYRVLVYTSLMESIARQGHGAEALKLLDEALDATQGLPTLRALVLLRTANLQRDVMRDFNEADRLYVEVIGEGRRLRHPLIREASIARGDMFMEAGDFARAGEAYRLARSLGSAGMTGATQEDPTKRGALLRVAEQQLKEGDIRQTRRILHRIENEYPEQKLEGLYRFLVGEAERHAGYYDKAVQHYEVLMHLRQWASYRPHAVFGIADSYYRMGDFGNALTWLTTLSETYPEFFEQRHLDDTVVRIRTRQSHLTSTNGQTRTLFTSIDDPFDFPEPTEPPESWHRRLTLAFEGNHALVFEGPAGRRQIAEYKLANLPSQGNLWLEFWYRSLLGVANIGSHRQILIEVYDENGTRIHSEPFDPERTYGRWQKAAFRLPLPATYAGTVRLYAECAGERLEFDALRLEHVSDREENALRNFIEGADPQ